MHDRMNYSLRISSGGYFGVYQHWPPYQPWLQIAIGLISVTAATLASLQTFFRFSEKPKNTARRPSTGRCAARLKKRWPCKLPLRQEILLSCAKIAIA